MKKIINSVAVVAAYLCISAAAMAQNAGTATNHAFVLGKGVGQQGYTSLLCTSAQLAVGQTAADPICRTITGDVTITAGGVTAIGANVVHSSMLNADVFSTAHSWSAIQSFSTLVDMVAIAAPATPAAGHGSVWVDSTDKRIHDKNDAGTIGTTVVASTCSASQWFRSISTAGVAACSQPAFTDISGTITTAQLPGLASALIWVGNGSSLATAVSMSADCTLANTGAITCTKTNGVAFGPFATIASQTSNAIYKGNGASAPIVSALTDDGSKVSTSENIDLTSKALEIEVANAGVTGTTLNMLAKLTGAPSTAVLTATTDTGGVIGIVVGGAGTTSNARIAVNGQASCVFDGATVAGDYVQISGTVNGNCHDAGATYPSANQVIGRVMSTNAAGGTFVVLLNDEIKAAAGGGGGITSVTPGGGLVSATTAACSQTAITTSGTLSKAECVNAQVGTSYAIADSDRAKLITANNTAAQAYTIAQAGAASNFQAGWFADISNINAPSNPSGIVTLTPTTSTINGLSSYALYPGMSGRLVSDGSNYRFIAANPGQWQLLNTMTASSSANLRDTTSFTAQYSEYEIVFENILAATASSTGQFQVVTSGPTVQTTTYLGQGVFSSAATPSGLGGTTFIPVGVATGFPTTSPGFSGRYHVSNPTQTTQPKMFTGTFCHQFSSAAVCGTSGGWWNGANSALIGIQFSIVAGNIASGTIKVYGRN